MQLAAVALVDLERGQQVQGAGEVVGRGLEHHVLQRGEVTAAQQRLDLMAVVQAQAHAQGHALLMVLLIVVRGPEAQAIEAAPGGVLAAGSLVVGLGLGQFAGNAGQGGAVVQV
ncbi:hypothetical protein D9M71_444690 [compost metagenome]